MNLNEKLNIFTTRPDTIYGASFIAVSVNHTIVKNYLNEQKLKKLNHNLQIFKMIKRKLGIPLNATCEHPILDQELPIYIANFVLDNYGEGEQYLVVQHMMREILNLLKI